jgi:hypothetical protein
MCACNQSVSSHSPQQSVRNIQNTNCLPLQYYVDILAQVKVRTDTQYDALKSYVVSQINIYNKECSMFKEQIETLKFGL